MSTSDGNMTGQIAQSTAPKTGSLDDFGEESILELKEGMKQTLLEFHNNGAVNGWKLSSATFDDGYYYDESTDAAKEVTRIRLESTGKVAGQKIFVSGTITAGVVKVRSISAGDKYY